MKVFISHSSNDKKFVRRLKDDLIENGFETFFDEDSLELGDSLKERLDVALDEADFFIIILSSHAVKSDWVKYELAEAVKLFANRTLKKIIPIKYRECEIPAELEKLLYTDLSKETVKIIGKKVKIIGGVYDKFLVQLTATLRASDNKLTKSDKTELRKEVDSSEQKIQQEVSKYITMPHKIYGFKDVVTRELYQKKIATALQMSGYMTYYPVILPSFYQSVFKHLKVGDRLVFQSNNGINMVIGNFAGYRISESEIILDSQIRRSLKLNVRAVRYFKVNVEDKTFVVSN